MKYCNWLALLLLIGVAGCASKTDYSANSQATVIPSSGSLHSAAPAFRRNVSLLHFVRPRQGGAAMQRPGSPIGTAHG